MKNLEIKLKLDNFESVRNIMKDYYIDLLTQKDTYFQVSNGRLKLREENTGTYFIRYYRVNSGSEKISNYHFYPIKNKIEFDNVFGGSMNIEVIVDKTRELYIYENARIHLDTVLNLGTFLEIEVVIKTIEEENKSKELFQKLMDMMNINNNQVIECGYRELLIKENPENKNLNYYATQNKVFWVIGDDINDNLKAKQVVPCIFAEKTKEDGYAILQFDESIKFDDYKYTGWRKLIGQEYNVWIEVFLIVNDMLYNLKGDLIDFNIFGRSNVIVGKEFLAKFVT